MVITATELKRNLGEYLQLAAKEDIFITRSGKVILNNRIRNREGEPENDDVRKAFSFNTDTFPICACSQEHRVRIFLKLIQNLVLR